MADDEKKLQALIAASIAAVGLRETAKRLALSEVPVLRLAHGLSVRRGTVTAARSMAERLPQGVHFGDIVR
jgi:hypothetical protein